MSKKFPKLLINIIYGCMLMLLMEVSFWLVPNSKPKNLETIKELTLLFGIPIKVFWSLFNLHFLCVDTQEFKINAIALLLIIFSTKKEGIMITVLILETSLSNAEELLISLKLGCISKGMDGKVSMNKCKSLNILPNS